MHTSLCQIVSRLFLLSIISAAAQSHLCESWKLLKCFEQQCTCPIAIWAHPHSADNNLITNLTQFQGCLKGLFSIHSLGEQLFINHFNYSQESFLVWHFIKSSLTQMHPSSEVFSCGFRLHLHQLKEKCFLNISVLLPPMQHFWGLMDSTTYYRGKQANRDIFSSW